VLVSLVLAGGLFFQLHRGGGGAAGHDRNSVKGSTEPGTVLVARRLIPKGTSWSSIAYFNLFAVVTIPKGQIAPGAISDPAVLQGRAAAVDIYPNQQLVAAVDIYPNQQLETSNFSRRFDITPPH
jgi:pilus assembly protein CpaB